MSGYVDGAVAVDEIEPEAEYLQKPFSPEALAARVRRTLKPVDRFAHDPCSGR
jgi:DNA-binding response OmpR family regulator